MSFPTQPRYISQLLLERSPVKQTDAAKWKKLNKILDNLPVIDLNTREGMRTKASIDSKFCGNKGSSPKPV